MEERLGQFRFGAKRCEKMVISCKFWLQRFFFFFLQTQKKMDSNKDSHSKLQTSLKSDNNFQIILHVTYFFKQQCKIISVKMYCKNMYDLKSVVET